ncbi:hypothetical protein G6F55_014490 [Rhizopus delemar]|nr:hypothetical protein G6F55_014490 [Rhizopus delemar]
MNKLPSPGPSITSPVCTSTSSGRMPIKGMLAEPGLQALAPGMGAISMPPVSVCLPVSTTGQRPTPTTS